jgi:6-phosphogluconate dehydrogenase
MLVPAGPIVDQVIEEVKPFLSEGDLLMDWGNSHFSDTNNRYNQLAKSTIHFMGVGISGGESGARFGPSIMPGGPKEVYNRVSAVLDSISAKVNNEPCVTWLGTGSAGHYVKMVHNGIEYGLMQLIAEAYHVLKVAGLTNDELHTTFSSWNNGRLHSFLIEITAAIFKQQDELTSNRLVDMILDTAHQKGTGGWTSRDAMNLQVPIPSIDMAVTMRGISSYKKERVAIQQKLKGPDIKFQGDKKNIVDLMEQALYFSMITTYAQGLELLHAASKKYQYDLKLENIGRIWRGGCIIRAALLEDIRAAYAKQPELSNLLVSDLFSEKLMTSQGAMRNVIKFSVDHGVPVLAMMSSLAYYDSYRSGWLPANLVQAQRDYFGAHTYERVDREGTFHTHWN